MCTFNHLLDVRLCINLDLLRPNRFSGGNLLSFKSPQNTIRPAGFLANLTSSSCEMSVRRKVDCELCWFRGYCAKRLPSKLTITFPPTVEICWMWTSPWKKSKLPRWVKGQTGTLPFFILHKKLSHLIPHLRCIFNILEKLDNPFPSNHYRPMWSCSLNQIVTHIHGLIANQYLT